ncbi:MAG: alpha/beta hydrolase [Alphaproteobacteria bacterium]|nr:alpha/beta hydrolase [Alphaproteobacteria bacterium]MDP6818681.1 alpha/beta hydrolase [Alphaproteobacteria bacterium]
MAYANSGGVKLHCEETGSGHPILFIHEFAGDHRSWEPQIRYFSRRYRCISYDARGYPPSDVPDDAAHYSQDIAVADAIAVLDHYDIDKAHIVGLSMGGFAALHIGMRHGQRASALVVAGCGYGAPKGKQESFQREVDVLADHFERDGSEKAAEVYAGGPYRVQHRNKDPRGWAEFRAQFIEHSPRGSANTLRGVQGRRPSLYDLEAELAAIAVPTLLINGDEDEPCLDATLWLKRVMPASGLVILPRTGHASNLEEPDAFNRAAQEFFSTAEQGRWTARDPRSISETQIVHAEEEE